MCLTGVSTVRRKLAIEYISPKIGNVEPEVGEKGQAAQGLFRDSGEDIRETDQGKIWSTAVRYPA